MAKPPLFLIRHGAAEGVEGRLVGQWDAPLSAPGAASIQALAASWTTAPPRRLWSSDLRRASQSAELLAERWGVQTTIDPRLREIDFGTWDGKPWDDLRAEHGPAFDRFMQRWHDEPPPEGEPFEDLDERAHAWLGEAWTEETTGPVVAVAHGGSIRALLRRALDMPTERIFHLHLDHGFVSVLEHTWRGTTIRHLNSDRFPTLPKT